MTPIRLALIGLSQSSTSSWASQAHLPYLLSKRGKQKYHIAALLNSSAEAARRAIEYYKLGTDVKAYGSPDDLAADPDIDLVVCSTRVDVHYETVKPSVAAGKNVFVEWPLAQNVQRARELADLAKTSGSRTMVGLQARGSPQVAKLKELVDSEVIGKVVSSDVQAWTPGNGGDSISEGFAYFFDKSIGGNPMTIIGGHMTDLIHFILGGEYATSHSQTQIQRPNQTIRSNPPRQTISNVPDLISIHGTLSPNPHNTSSSSSSSTSSSTSPSNPSTLIITYHTGPPFPGTTPFTWTITGTKGELRISSKQGPTIHFDPSLKIEHHTFSTTDTETRQGEVKEIPWEWEKWQIDEDLPIRARGTGKLYELWFEGEENLREAGMADFEAAVERHARIDGMMW